ncbi:MAG: hypothetical protein ACTHJR_11155 [Sphingomonas sp.]|uniref:hypothetical protein n=1 Tax=Sphingomonas sp. TaxID=28214 RepID=UPI003F7D2EA8
MSQDQLIQLAGSVVAILALAGVARWLKLGESRIANEDDARRFAEEALAGFEGGRALVSGDGCAALVAGHGAIAVVKRHGAKVAVRRLVPPVEVHEAVEGATVETGERLFGPVVLFGITADQVRGLEAPLTLV